jgi:hypothetical protein
LAPYVKPELTAEYVEEFVLRAVNMQGRRVPKGGLMLEEADGVGPLAV